MPDVSREDVKRLAAAAGFDISGIAPVEEFAELGFLKEWLERGYHADMQYLARNADRRADVRAVVPSARSVIMLGTVYNADRPYSTLNNEPARANVARYAWGDDYHPVIEERMRTLVEGLRAIAGEFEHRAYVTPARSRSVSTPNTPGWVGSARIPASSIVTLDRGSSSPPSSARSRSKRTFRPSTTADGARCASTRVQPMRWSRPISSTRGAACRI